MLTYSEWEQAKRVYRQLSEPIAFYFCCDNCPLLVIEDDDFYRGIIIKRKCKLPEFTYTKCRKLVDYLKLVKEKNNEEK